MYYENVVTILMQLSIKFNDIDKLYFVSLIDIANLPKYAKNKLFSDSERLKNERLSNLFKISIENKLLLSLFNNEPFYDDITEK